MKNIFISGSYQILTDKENKIADDIAYKLVTELYKSDCNIYTGVGKGLGAMITGYANYYLEKRNLKNDGRLVMEPFPFHNKDLAEKYGDSHRVNLIRKNQYAIFMFGQKPGMDFSQGVIDEFNIAKENGLMVIPIGATGYSASFLCRKIKDDITAYPYLEKYIDILTNEVDSDRIVQTIITIINDNCFK